MWHEANREQEEEENRAERQHESEGGTVRLLSSDDQEFEVSAAVMRQSVTLSNMLD